MGNELEGVKVIDIQKKEIQQRPLNNLSPFNYSSHSIQNMSPPSPPRTLRSHAPMSIADKRKSISNIYIADQTPLTLSPIASDSPPPPPVSAKTVQYASDFWTQNIESLSMELRLEIGWSIYIGMLVSHYEIQKLFDVKCKTIKQIESTSLKFLDMVGFLVRGMCNQSYSVSVHKSLQKLGDLHANIGVTLKHYAIMIQQVHQTFEIYFHEAYPTQIRWCVHKILAHCVRFMTEENLKMPNEPPSHDTFFLQSLDMCLESEIGRRKLFRYLQRSEGKEMVIFLHLYDYFKICTNAQTRYMIARYIMKACMDVKGRFSMQTPTYKKIMRELAEFEANCHEDTDFVLVSKCFAQMEHNIHQRIMQNHWTEFKRSICNRQSM